MTIKSEKYPEGFIIKKNYPNGKLAVFYHNKDGEPLAELSVFEDSIELTSNEIVLKNYSENSEIAHELVDSQILIPTDRFVLIRSHLCPICKVAV
ncbi:MAG: hypothetical protein HWN66_21660 [Candidatus Helarchaeota archaeon]|nr:hypothetical protein [Candidatus Helarchaeota archaeon]